MLCGRVVGFQVKYDVLVVAAGSMDAFAGRIRFFFFAAAGRMVRNSDMLQVAVTVVQMQRHPGRQDAVKGNDDNA